MPGITVLTISCIIMKHKAMSDMVVPPGTNGLRRSARSTLGTRFSLQKEVLHQSPSGQRLCCVSQQTHHIWIRPSGSVPQPRSLSIPRRHPDGLACGLPAASSAGQSLARGVRADPARGGAMVGGKGRLIFLYSLSHLRCHDLRHASSSPLRAVWSERRDA